MAMVATIPSQTPQHLLQIESFWNLINTSDDAVQMGIFTLLEKKYNHDLSSSDRPRLSFRQMKGALAGMDDVEQLRNEYINEKYGL